MSQTLEDRGMELVTDRCTCCGRVENIDLLDGGGEAFGKSESDLECIACYGPDWLPSNADDIHKSCCSSLGPIYRQYIDSLNYQRGN